MAYEKIYYIPEYNYTYRFVQLLFTDEIDFPRLCGFRNCSSERYTFVNRIIIPPPLPSTVISLRFFNNGRRIIEIRSITRIRFKTHNRLEHLNFCYCFCRFQAYSARFRRFSRVIHSVFIPVYSIFFAIYRHRQNIRLPRVSIVVFLPCTDLEIVISTVSTCFVDIRMNKIQKINRALRLFLVLCVLHGYIIRTQYPHLETATQRVRR